MRIDPAKTHELLKKIVAKLETGEPLKGKPRRLVVKVKAGHGMSATLGTFTDMDLHDELWP